MSVSSDLEALLARIVDHHVATGTLLPVNDVVGDRSELAAPLAGLVRQYLAVADALDGVEASWLSDDEKRTMRAAFETEIAAIEVPA